MRYLQLIVYSSNEDGWGSTWKETQYEKRLVWYSVMDRHWNLPQSCNFFFFKHH